MYDKDTDKKIKPTTNEHTLFVRFFVVTRTGVEPMISP